MCDSLWQPVDESFSLREPFNFNVRLGHYDSV